MTNLGADPRTVIFGDWVIRQRELHWSESVPGAGLPGISWRADSDVMTSG
jgi:hypothetical protein